MKLALRVVLGVILAGVVILAGIIIFSFFKIPQTGRNWSEEFSRTASATTTPDGHIILSNVRDWTYGKNEILSKDWETITVDPATVTKVWFVTEPFSSLKAIGHTFLTFEFADGTALSFSIEAKREAGESYSAVRGLFNDYELAYQWGTERDFITRRLLYLDHPVRRYPLVVTPAMAQALFRGTVEQTNTLASKPRFYNTLTENCTNTLAYIVNSIAPHTLPYDISWNLTGFADLYLMKQKFIVEVGGSPEATRNAYDLTSWKTEITAAATTGPQDFSALLNTDLEQR